MKKRSELTSRYYTISYPKRTHDFVKMNFGFSVEWSIRSTHFKSEEIDLKTNSPWPNFLVSLTKELIYLITSCYIIDIVPISIPQVSFIIISQAKKSRGNNKRALWISLENTHHLGSIRRLMHRYSVYRMLYGNPTNRW